MYIFSVVYISLGSMQFYTITQLEKDDKISYKYYEEGGEDEHNTPY